MAVYVLDVPPNWERGVTERLEWSTNILKSREGYEQRFSLRVVPRQTIEYDFLVYKSQLQKFRMQLQGSQGGDWIVPVWFNMQKLPASVSFGSSSVSIETTQHEWEAAEYALIYSDPTRYEAVPIATVSPTGITLQTPLTKDWGVGSWVVPAKLAHLTGTIELSALTPEVFTGRIQAQFNQFTTPVLSPHQVLNGKPYLDHEPNWVAARKASWQRNTGVIDYGVGNIVTYDLNGFSETVRDFEYLTHERSSIHELRSFLYQIKGKWKGFYVPTYTNDLTLVTNQINAVDTTIQVEHTYFSENLLSRILTMYIQVRTKSGGQIITRIVNFSSTSSTETLYLETAFGTTVQKSNIERICFVFVTRLDADVVEFNWTTPEIFTTLLSFRGVLN